MNHHLESLGWTLVNFCWQAAAIAFMYWLADAALSKARSQTRYVLALAALLLMLLGALATFAYEETRSQAELSSPAVSSSPANAAIGSSIRAARCLPWPIAVAVSARPPRRLLPATPSC